MIKDRSYYIPSLYNIFIHYPFSSLFFEIPDSGYLKTNSYTKILAKQNIHKGRDLRTSTSYKSLPKPKLQT